MLFSSTLSTGGSTRATGYGMSNKVITDKGRIFVTWLDHVSDIQVKAYDIAADCWSETVLLGRGVDNHSGPAMTMDSRGYLYVVFGPHHDPFRFRRSSRPYDIAKWEPVRRFGARGTYPSLICDADDMLHCAYRGGPSPPRLMYQRKPRGGRWTMPREIVSAALDKPQPAYTQYGNSLAVSVNGTIHLGFHIYDEQPPGGKSLGYLRSRDKGKTWETADGTIVKLPATPETACFIEQGGKLDMRIGNLVVDTGGRPWLTAAHLEKRPRSVMLWRHDGGSWKSRDLLPDVRKHLPGCELVEATMTFDRDGIMYVACTVGKVGVRRWFGHRSLEIVLLTSTDDGRTFEATPISTVDPRLANWFPSVERPFGPRPTGVPSILYTHGGAGVGCKGGKATEVLFVRLEKPGRFFQAGPQF